MTKSNKHKNERKKDFQKEKLKVGKARPKNTNATDTSFAARCTYQYGTHKRYCANEQQQSSSSSKVSPKPVVKLAHSSTTTFRSSTAKTTISEKMLSLFSLTQSPRRQHLGRSLLQSLSPKLSL
jgi:pre-rRNA-processing protein IPI1